jgi:hypothetical protein
MSQWGKEYEEIRRIWHSDVQPTFIGFDVESHEFGHHDLLEVGWSVVGPQRQQETSHYLMEEAYYDGLKNGRHVPDNRRDFRFGKVLHQPLVGTLPRWPANGTEIAMTLAVGKHFKSLIKSFRRKGPVYVVFHDSKGDMKVMESLGIDTTHWSYSLLTKSYDKQSGRGHVSTSNGDPLLTSLVDDDDEKEDGEGLHSIYVLDTQLLFAALRCGGNGQKRGLQHICIALNVNEGVLGGFHNAGECFSLSQEIG